MLLNQEAEERVLGVIKSLASAYSVYMVGRELGQTVAQAAGSALGMSTTQRLTFLEQSYLAGKIAKAIGPDRLKRMSEQQLTTWIQNNPVEITPADRVLMNQLKTDTQRWLSGRTDAWQAKMRTEIVKADRGWRAALATNTFNDARALSIARNSALGMLWSELEGVSKQWDGDIDRLIQSEMNNYFQHGQVSGTDKETYVWKVPRASACENCMRITLNIDGSPKKYKLSEVEGNSNIGLPAYSWQFTIGPLHPYCYCILYSEDVVAYPGEDEELAEARRASMEGLKKAHSCGGPIDPETLFEEQLGRPHEHRPLHENLLLKAVKSVYGDTLPGS